MFDVYESWSGKFDISAVFSVTPNVGILFRHPYTLVLRHPSDGLFRQLFLQCDIIYSNIYVDVMQRSYCCCLSCIYCSTRQPSTTGCYSTLVIMKQISEVEEKPFTSSLLSKKCLQAKKVGAPRIVPLHYIPPAISQLVRGYFS
jgi:hypothetical protein